jgi:hypothetical protein
MAPPIVPLVSPLPAPPPPALLPLVSPLPPPATPALAPDVSPFPVSGVIDPPHATVITIDAPRSFTKDDIGIPPRGIPLGTELHCGSPTDVSYRNDADRKPHTSRETLDKIQFTASFSRVTFETCLRTMIR